MIHLHPRALANRVLLTGALLFAAAIPLLHAQSNFPGTGLTETREDQQSLAIRNKLNNIIIPRLEFHSTTLGDAIEFLRQESRRVDVDPDPEARGVNIFLKLPAPAASASRPIATTTDASIPGLPAAPSASVTAPVPVGVLASANTRITLTLNRLPLLEALKYIATQAGLRVKVEPYAVSLVPLAEDTDTLVTATFRVPPNFIGNESAVGAGSLLDQPATSATH